MGAKEYLIKKGFKKVHQPKKRYNLTIEELVIMLEEFSNKQSDFRQAQIPDTNQMKLWI